MRQDIKKKLLVSAFSLISYLGLSQSEYLLITETPSKDQIITNKNASNSGDDCYILTQAINSQGGSFWYKSYMNLNADFDFIFSVYLGNKDQDGADGIAFVMQPRSTGEGSSGGGLGYQGISPSIAVEFDTYQNDDPIQDHISIQPNGNVNTKTSSLAKVTMPNMEDGQEHLVQITWTSSIKTLKIYWDNSLKLELKKNLVSNFFKENPKVYWGWTGSTGGANNLQKVCIVSTKFSE